jgi:predicted unusual protein kinase regulating ubiquinone biosynthesis (AarF/ABC1/UbiB family)
MLGIIYLLSTGILCWFHQSRTTYRILFNSIQYNGCFAIKIAQWICARNDFDYNKKYGLSDIFNKNNTHTYKHTKQIFKQEYSKDIENIYTDIEIISSGSIAQVYKCRHIQTNEYHAIKVKHPNLYKNLNYLWKVFSFIIILSKWTSLMSCLKLLHFTDHNELFKTFVKQTDFFSESEAIKYFYERFENNDSIIIPKLYDVSENIIIMKYEESRNIAEINDSYLKYELVLLFQIFYKQMGYNEKYLHCDLHVGNWGVKNNSLVIYDFGYCLDQTPEINDRTKRFVLSYETFDVKTCENIMLNEFLINNYATDGEMSFMGKEFNLNSNLKTLVEFCETHEKNNTKLDFKTIEFMISYNCVELVCKTNLNHYYDGVDREKFSDVCKEIYIAARKHGFDEIADVYYNLSEKNSCFTEISTDDVSNFYQNNFD